MNINKANVTYSSIVQIGENITKIERETGDKYIRLLQFLIRNGMYINAGDLVECFRYGGVYTSRYRDFKMAPGVFSVLLSCKSFNLDEAVHDYFDGINITCMERLIRNIERYFKNIDPKDKPQVAGIFKYMFRLLCLRGCRLTKPPRFSYWRDPGLSASEVEKLDLEAEQDRQLIDIYDLIDAELSRRAAPDWSQEEDLREFERLTGFRIGQFDPPGEASRGGASQGGAAGSGGKRRREE